MAGGLVMADKRKKKNKAKTDNWRLPENAWEYFDPRYDDDYRSRHPVLYCLTVVVIFILLLAAPIAYIYLCSRILHADSISSSELTVWILGWISSFGISIGLCNLFLIIHDQYLGHYVTVFSFIIGFVGTVLSLEFLC